MGDRNLEREKESEEKKENRQVTSSVGAISGNKFNSNANMKKVKRKVNKEDMGSFFFEKELLQKFRNMFSDAISLIFSPEVLSDIETGTIIIAFLCPFPPFLSKTGSVYFTYMYIHNKFCSAPRIILLK
jgi:hypothetical protein